MNLTKRLRVEPGSQVDLAAIDASFHGKWPSAEAAKTEIESNLAYIWKPRYDFINNWEKLLAAENNTTILKFFLYISKEEQLSRFKERLDDPARQWKISDNDYSERELWADYIRAFEAALSRCSTKYAPWFVIPANHKWFRNLSVSQIIADALDDMKLELPKPTVNLKKIRRLYHKDAAVQASNNRRNKGGKK